MTDLNDAFEVDSLLVGEGNVLGGIITSDLNPSQAPGQEAPLGSFLMQSTGKHWKKTGPGNLDWKEADAPNILQFCDRSGAEANISIVDVGVGYVLTFFNRAGISEDIVII